MTPAALTGVIDATWPAAQLSEVAGWTIREGQGGGSRVSAATANHAQATGTIVEAEAAMRALGQTPLFMLREGEDAIDRALAARGYAIKDPVTVYECGITDLATRRPPPVTCFEVWPPLAVQADIWAEGGIGSARLDVMDRVRVPHTTILGRLDDTPAGCLFAAVSDPALVVHAVETTSRFRRRGLARHMMTAAAFWGQEHGARQVLLLVTDANAAANALYRAMGMQAVSRYHYRIGQAA